MTIYNPSGAAVHDVLAVSMYYAGFAPNDRVTVTPVRPGDAPGSPAVHTVGADGGAIYDIVLAVDLPAYSYGLFSIST